MAASEKKPQQPKGRLELMMDEFTEVHGTVLVGMHKELQTIRTDVEKQVASQIAETLKQFEKVNAKLAARAEKAEMSVTKLEAKVAELKDLLRLADKVTAGLQESLPAKPKNSRANRERAPAPKAVTLEELLRVR